MKKLLLQIVNKKIDNLLPKDVFDLYKYLYNYKLKDCQIKMVLSGISNLECSSNIERILLLLFFNNKIKIDNITDRIYLQEYFPNFDFLIFENEDCQFQLILEFYKIINSTNRNTNRLNNLLNRFINNNNSIILYSNRVNNFVIHYNTKRRILRESDNSFLINCICQYLTNENIENLYEKMEDKQILNIEINKRNLFNKLINKVIIEALVNPINLVNLKIDKKVFFIFLNKLTMTHRDILENNIKKYLQILKIIKYKKKYILLVEWMKTFIYFGRIDLFRRLYKDIKKKITKEESELFLIIYKNIKHYYIFLMKCGYFKDSEFCVYSYKDIINK